MGWKRKLKKDEVFKQELFDIMSKCDMWKRNGKCISEITKSPCLFLASCKIVKAYESKMFAALKKGTKTPYLPGVIPGQSRGIF